MKLSSYQDRYYKFTEIASEVNRKAAFAGIAVIWVFKTSIDGVDTPPEELLIPLALFSLGLTLDLLQYVVASAIWAAFFRYHDARRSTADEDPDLSHSPALSLPIYLFFVLKFFFVISAYAALSFFLVAAWAKTSG